MTAGETSRPTGTERSLLLADDEIAICRSLEALLCARGYAVTTTTDGGEARRLIAANRYAFLLLDVNLPSVTGLELARFARREGAQSRIVIITGILDPAALELDDRERRDFVVLSKPFHLKDLLESLDQKGPVLANSAPVSQDPGAGTGA